MCDSARDIKPGRPHPEGKPSLDSGLFIFGTNIRSRLPFKAVKKEPMKVPGVIGWRIDMSDCDRVLRLECVGMNIDLIEESVKSMRFECVELEE